MAEGHGQCEKEPCSFNSENSKCHQKKYSVTRGIRKVKEDEFNILKLRSSIADVSRPAQICTHHEKELLTNYSFEQRKCADPFKKHKKPISKSLKIITVPLWERFQELDNLPIEVTHWKEMVSKLPYRSYKTIGRTMLNRI